MIFVQYTSVCIEYLPDRLHAINRN
jgi:hypothetical protein